MNAPVEAVTLTLRAAVPADAYLLWVWANDAGSRSASFGREPIAWESHVAWLAGCLGSPAHQVLIAGLSSGQPVGLIRFDTADGWQTARLSYTIAPEARGRGLAVVLVRAGVTALHATHHGAVVRAEVTPDNERSLKVFRRAGGWVEAESGRADVVTFRHQGER